MSIKTILNPFRFWVNKSNASDIELKFLIFNIVDKSIIEKQIIESKVVENASNFSEILRNLILSKYISNFL